MNKVTERLVQVAAVLVIGWYSWTFTVNTVVSFIQLNQQVAQLQQSLRQCQEKK